MRMESGTIVLEIPQYDSRIEVSRSADGSRLDGRWQRGPGGGRGIELPFHATAGPAPRFLRAPGESGPDVATALPERWVVDFETRSVPSVALLHGKPDGTVQGTFLHISGDYRYLEGEFRNGRLRLSRFDGAHAFLFDARLRDDGTLGGTFWEGDYLTEPWTARADPDAHLLDPFSYLRVDPQPDLESLVAYDLEGKPCALAEDWTPGRALIIEILGTWCPNCHDASKLLMELRDEYGDRGLDILGIAFQFKRDFQRNAGDVRRYRDRHGITYPLRLASAGAPVPPSDFFPPLAGEYAFPTIVFLDRQGRVHATYTGFTGPAAGEEHELMKARWRAVIEAMLAEGS